MVERREDNENPYKKVVSINSCDVSILLDTGNYYSLLKFNIDVSSINV